MWKTRKLWMGVVALVVLGPCAVAQVTDYRSPDGTNNNAIQYWWGSKFAPTMRGPSGSHYADGIEALAGPNRPNPRDISNALFDQHAFIPDPDSRSDWVWAWGQWVDHDITLHVEQQIPPEFANIPVPAGDPVFDPGGTGEQFMVFERSQVFFGENPGGPREQFNDISTWLDGSQVYGHNQYRALVLRRYDGTGKLNVSESAFGDLLPYNVWTLPNAKDPEGLMTNQFAAGDPRCNEHIVLTSLHVLFVREHNWWCDRLAQEHPEWDEDTLYQMARKIVGAELETITYRDYLPALIGDRVPEYTGYDPDTNPSIRHAFATAAFRLGHTQVSGLILRLNEDLSEIDEGHILVRDCYFRPDILPSEGGIEPVLRGLANQVQEKTDLKVKHDLRNFLFQLLHGNPRAIPLDLISLNIQRGRDHGLPDYNTVRTDYGLPKRESFYQITSDTEVAGDLQALYGDIDDIDLFVGILSEDPLPGSVLGETGTAIIVDQFTRLRDGDRFWCANDPDMLAHPELMDEIEATTLRDIVLRNTTITAFPDDPFFACPLFGDVDKDKSVGIADLNVVLSNFGQSVVPGGYGDVDGTGVVDTADLNEVLRSFGDACER